MISTLTIFFFLSVKNKLNSFCIYVLLALSISAIGDGLLAFTQGDVKSLYYQLGLVFFLLSHIFYAFAFLNAPDKRGKGYLQKNPGWIIPLLIILIVTVGFLWPDIPGNLRIPIGIYSQVIIYMALAAFNLKNQISTSAFSTLILGTILLIFSDLMIAFIRFKVDQIYIPQPRLVMVLPYLAGQYFLMIGSLKLMNSNLKEN